MQEGISRRRGFGKQGILAVVVITTNTFFLGSVPRLDTRAEAFDLRLSFFATVLLCSRPTELPVSTQLLVGAWATYFLGA